MTQSHTNPLETLGIPKWVVAGIWGDKSLSQDRRIDLIMNLVKEVYRGLGRALHSDRMGENPFIRPMTEAYEDIEPEVLAVIIGRYLNKSDIQREKAAQDAERQVDQAGERLRLFQPFLGMADWRKLVGGLAPRELAFGLPANLWTEGNDYRATYLVACQDSGIHMVHAVHPMDNDPVAPVVAEFSNPPVWEKGRWRVHDYDLSTPPPFEDKTFEYAALAAYGAVTLVGQVSPEALHSLGSALRTRPEPRMSTVRSLVAPPPQTESRELVWWEPAHAWWLGGLEPRVQPGNYGVVARGQGDQLRLTIVGKLLAERPL